MLSTKFVSLMPRAARINRLMSTATKLTIVEVNDRTGIATLTLNRPPINALNLELLRDVHQSIQKIEHNKSRGLILTSANARIFSAGLDINEMYKPDNERARLLWLTLQDVWTSLYGSKLPTAAAINGHAPAGGCLLATCCEYRAMLPKFSIGLNEPMLGIVQPIFCMFNFLNVLPRRLAERSLNQGKIFSTEEALRIGLIDDVANSKEAAMAKCVEFISSFDKVNPVARSQSKLQFRAANLQQFEKERAKDLETFVSIETDSFLTKSVGKKVLV